MSYAFYKTLHYLGFFLVFAALGGSLVHAMNGGTKDNNPSRKLLAIGHGLGLTLVVIAGFGMLAKLGIHGVPGWAAAKIVVWLVIGALLVVPNRLPHLAKPVYIALPFLGALAGWLALAKPF